MKDLCSKQRKDVHIGNFRDRLSRQHSEVCFEVDVMHSPLTFYKWSLYSNIGFNMQQTLEWKTPSLPDFQPLAERFEETLEQKEHKTQSKLMTL